MGKTAGAIFIWRRRFAISAIVAFALVASATADAHNFGEKFLNLNVYFSAANGGENLVRRLPSQAGVWDLRADAKNNTRIKISGADDSQPYLKLACGDKMKEAFLYSPKGLFEFSIPAKSKTYGDGNDEIPDGYFKLKVAVPTYADFCRYKNLACNPYDFQTKATSFYPHASASSECRGELQFAVRNSISGIAENKKHSGWKYRSWGPEQEGESEIKIDFGREVEIDKLIVFLRADFPHDDIWDSAFIEFSDSHKIPVKFKKTADAQIFKFPMRKTTSVKISALKGETKAWRAITEIEAWGRDIPPFEAFGADGKLTPFADAVAALQTPKNKTLNRFTWRLLEEIYPLESDSFLLDAGFDLTLLPTSQNARAEFFKKLCLKALERVADKNFADMCRANLTKNLRLGEVSALYVDICRRARREFLRKLNPFAKEYAYVERYPIAPSFYGYTEGASDARGEAIFAPDSALCLLRISDDFKITREVLLADKNGVIRDPDVSYDAKKIAFSWKNSLYGDDFHLYEIDLQTREIRQLTSGKCADIEPRYLPTGEIVFNSTRCEQATDCFNTEVSNLYIMRADGSFLRRVGFDQVCTTYPTVTERGNVVYTRWDYNDRGQTFPQGIFMMKPDGSFQTEVYGNKSWFPTVIGHARQIPRTQKYIATLHGHHTAQRGKLAEIDPANGRQENSGVELLAPRRKAEALRLDCYGQSGEQFQYPFPLSEDLFLVTYEPTPSGNRSYPSPYGLYLMDSQGRRELLVSHRYLDCKQAVAVASRKMPQIEKSRVDYSSDKGFLFIRNIYFGQGVEGVKKDSIKKVRVVKIGYRRAPIGYLNSRNDEGGVGVEAINCTPIALGQGAWDTKEILGEADVAPDGSVYFEIPARTPVYFQPIDKDGFAVTTMRSWTTMQPNEFYSCLGCHGDRDSPNQKALHISEHRRPQKLKPFYDVEGGFSFNKHIQPILDKHCISCHNDRSKARIISPDGKKISVCDIEKTRGQKWENIEKQNADKAVRAFSLLGYPLKNYRAKRFFSDSYYNLLQPLAVGGTPIYADFKNPLINWNGAQSVPTLLPPYFRGAAKSEIMAMLKKGHGKTKLNREELDKIAAWIDLYVPYCSDYYEANAWSESELKLYKYYEGKGRANESAERAAIVEYLEGIKKP